VTAGNILRCAIGTSDPLWRNVIYFRTLYKISNTKFLAQIENYYGSNYEDIILVIDTGSITEIPDTWHGNENLKVFLLIDHDLYGKTRENL
jgi:hypothetical protein